MRYDRQLLLLGDKRNVVLELAEVQACGRDSYGNADYVCIYGLRPAEWYAKGIRLLGRTAVECTRDELADRIGRDAASVAADWVSAEAPFLIDPFAGSEGDIRKSLDLSIWDKLERSYVIGRNINRAYLEVETDSFDE